MDNKNVIALIGPYGEVGGVSIHIRRLRELLASHFEFVIINESRIKIFNDSNIINLRSFSIHKYLLSIIKADIVHIHSGKKFLITFHLLIAFIMRAKTIVTIHGNNNPSWFFKTILRSIPFQVIAVNEENQTKNSIVLPAFIPPISELNEILDASIVKLIENEKIQGKFIITGNAFRLVEYQGGDLYGVDQLIELAEMFKSEKINAIILFFVGSLIKCKDKYGKYNKLIETKDIKQYIRLINQQVPFIKVIMEADLVVRPTLTDGDALTIREALCFNKPVIASDIVKRPKGTILYETSNVEDLLSKVKKILSNKIISQNINMSLEEYKRIYLKIYETSNTEL